MENKKITLEIEPLEERIAPGHIIKTFELGDCDYEVSLGHGKPIVTVTCS